MYLAKDAKNPGVSNLPPMNIQLEGLPPKSAPYRTNPRNMKFTAETLTKLLNTGNIRPCVGAFGAPVIVVAHPSGKLRMCVDYRKLNKVTKTELFPLPTLEDVLSLMGGKMFFSTFDLCQGYHQVKIAPEDQDKTAMVTHLGTFAWNVVGFGLKNAPSHFMRCMDMVLTGLNWKTCCVFVDDIIVFSDNFEDHLRDLSEVCRRLRKHKLSLHPDKCQLFKDQVVYLGYTISKFGIDPVKAKVEAILKWEPPKTLTKLRSFLYTVGFYRRLIKNFGARSRVLNDLLKKENQPFKPWGMDSPEQAAFEDLRTALTKTVTLKHVDYSKPFIIDIDACKDGLGAVLSQEVELPVSGAAAARTQQADDPTSNSKSEEISKSMGKRTKKFRWPCYFASRTLKGAERHQSPSRLEATAVLWALEYFKNFVLGSQTTVYTDHGPLTSIFKDTLKNSPLIRFQARFQEFEPYVNVVYRPGRVHSVPDGLSRLVKEDMSNDRIDLGKLLCPDERYVHAIDAVNASLTGSVPPPWEKPIHDAREDSQFLKRVKAKQAKDPEFASIRLVLLDREELIEDESDLLKAREVAKKFMVDEGLLYKIETQKMPDGK